MGKLAFLLVVASLWGVSNQRGCADLRKSITHLAYYPKRDMRSTVGIAPQKTYLRAPDSMSVPIGGREAWIPPGDAAGRARLEATFHNPQASDDSSIARGERKFMRTCVPCHGTTLAGNGPVAAKFIPPPDLLKQTTRDRSDGYIYGYIRNGGAVMPSYGAQVTPQEAHDLINFIRHMQQTSPR